MLRILLVLLFFPFSLFSQQILNPGFETWLNKNSLNNHPYQDPEFWNSPNYYTIDPLAGGFQVATQYTPAKQGSLSLKLESKFVPFISKVAPGMVSTGIMNLINPTLFLYTITGGQPFTGRPLKLSGQYQYTPSGTDTALVTIKLSKWNSATNQTILVAQGSWTQTSAVNAWTQFDVPLTYLTCHTPDSVLIVISSSSLTGNGGIGSIMLVDQLLFTYSTVPPPILTSNPVDVTICDGTDTSFKSSFTGVGSLLWQHDSNGTFANIKPGNPWYTGITSGNLKVLNAQAWHDKTKFRSLLIQDNCPVDTSTEAELTIIFDPEFTQHPQNKTICLGDNANFQSIAIGNDLTLQWQSDTGNGFFNLQNGTGFTGVNSNSLNVLTPSLLYDAAKFRIIASNNCGPNDTSNLAILNFTNSSSNISQQPSAIVLCPGNTGKIIIDAVSDSFQWQVDEGAGFININPGPAYNGMFTAELTLNNVQPFMNGFKYRVLLGSCNPPLISNAADLKVLSPANINFYSGPGLICSGSDLNFIVDASGDSLKYFWQIDSGAGFLDLQDDPVFDGTDSTNMKIRNTPSRFNGYKIRVRIQGKCGFPAFSNSKILNIKDHVQILTKPKDSTVCTGNASSFKITINPTFNTLRWQMDTGNGSFFTIGLADTIFKYSNTLQLVIPKTDNSMNNYRFRMMINDCGGTIYSDTVKLTVKRSPLADFTFILNPKKSVSFVSESLFNPTKFNWNFADQTQDTSSSSVNHTYVNDGPYNVKLSASNECGSHDTIKTVTINSTAIAETSFHNLLVYPNPVNDELFLNGISGSYEIKLVDIQGRTIFQKSLELPSALDLHEINPGVYFLQVEQDNSIQRVRIIKL